MYIQKLKSGSYRIRKTENGKNYSLTVPYKPSKKEADELIREKINKGKNKPKTFSKAIEEYLSIKEAVLSPSTIRGYKSIVRNIPEWFMECDINDIDNVTMQKLVAEYTIKSDRKESGHSAKSVSNLYGFCVSVTRFFRPEFDVSNSVKLPQRIHKKDDIPSLEDIKQVLEKSKGTPYYVPMYLAVLGLRESEITALTLNDLDDGDKLTIDKAYVRGEFGYVLKPTPKTDASNRTITIPSELADAIREQGFIYNGYPNQLLKYLQRTLKQLGIKQFTVHKMRHFFASYAHELGYSDAIIQSLGGWETDYVMKTVYRHAMNEDEAREGIKKDFSF